ncbi:MAG: branched-chain amino acid ABC transporter permease [Thermodesulfobacteriota bacterium]
MIAVFFQQGLNGLVLGSTYVLIALGLTMIFGILEVINFAHGEIYMIGAFLTLFLTSIFGIPFLFAIPIAMIGSGLFGLLIQRVVFRPIIGKPMINGMLISFGLSVFLMNLSTLLFKADPRSLDSGFAHLNIRFLGLQITFERLLVIIIAILLVSILYLFIQHTKVGRAMRAVAEDREAAQAVGINIDRIHLLTFGIGCALASAAGSLAGAIFFVSPIMGWAPVIKSFVVVILGGFGNVMGAILAGLILGIVESFGGGYISYAYKDAYAFVILLLAFLLKPEGLLGGNR